jgi:hypothetical protein
MCSHLAETGYSTAFRFLIRHRCAFSFRGDALIPVLTGMHYNTYSNHPERVESIFKPFLAIPDGD